LAADPSSTSAAHPLSDLGFDPGWAAAGGAAAGAPPAGCPARPGAPGAADPDVPVGRVVRADRGHAMMHTRDAPVHAGCEPDAVAGDRVPPAGDGPVGAVPPRRTFADIEELAAGCRFDDCAHLRGPGCAVVQAVADGRLAVQRLESMRRLQRELAWLRGRYDARLRAQRRREWQQLARQLRERGNRPGHR
jgi:ribosome biogenesis GTPase / thiamine phosphate phosphatase